MTASCSSAVLSAYGTPGDLIGRAMRLAILVLILVAANVIADTEIHRCLLEDGTFAFQEMPCAEPAGDTDDDNGVSEKPVERETPAANDDAFDFVNPFDEPARPEPVSRDRAECEKTTRDAIDAIDLEMRKRAYSKEQGQEYLAELLVLTRQLRACSRL